ncbi:ABC transporter substrate-binding protein [Amnibacterium kyonggiense]|uniref:Carbohydrate ABC transporter substrate-binding protein (CUT1 family) n=1 Tax=Amnibacterium kyonggiense TaxID=595671 RepID=A0A4V3EB73_9MICO|nr:extracellular solute-binding protein [Amnibacterium kyonggiense]TDS80574.1 carbohydrate ABC transporter substrate-binding protein (CUT1 family) [Amnibacterium kyonggiense]
MAGADISRRTFAGVGLGAVAALGLAACSSSSGAGSKGPLKFWNMPWGTPEFAKVDQQITEAFKPKSGLPAATYRSVQWSAFNQTFSTAVASNTGPAVSSGGGTQAFQFAKQGKIAYADGLLDSWKSTGLYDDFLPGLLDTMKTAKGYVAVPYHVDLRILWYRKSLLQKAGVSVPTDWQSHLDACAALKKIGVYGFGLSGGATGNAFQAFVGWMINNGGGIFDEEQKPNLVTPANIEALDYAQELIRKGYADPRSNGYSTANTQAQWKAGKFGMQVEAPGLASQVGGTVGPDMAVGEPLTSPSGQKGALSFPNNIMMYTNTPSQKDSEAFMTYYYKSMTPLWTKNLGLGLPVLKSIAATPEFRADANLAKIADAWQPVAKTWAAPGGAALFANVALVDSTQPMTIFGQNVIALKPPKTVLQTLQSSLEAGLKG